MCPVLSLVPGCLNLALLINPASAPSAVAWLDACCLMSAGLMGAVVLWITSRCRAPPSALLAANTKAAAHAHVTDHCLTTQVFCWPATHPPSTLLQVGDTTSGFALSLFVDLTYQWGNNSLPHPQASEVGGFCRLVVMIIHPSMVRCKMAAWLGWSPAPACSRPCTMNVDFLSK